jgi:hypothetical protein
MASLVRFLPFFALGWGTFTSKSSSSGSGNALISTGSSTATFVLRPLAAFFAFGIFFPATDVTVAVVNMLSSTSAGSSMIEGASDATVKFD